MPDRPISVTLDLSCILDDHLTGVGYAALLQAQALLLRAEAQNFEYRLFGARSRRGPRSFHGLEESASSTRILSYVRRIKYGPWARAQWPPIDWFCGKADIAHDLFHQLPPAKGRRIVTVHDLTFLRFPEVHTPQTLALQTRLVRQAVQKADAIVSVSQSGKNDLVELMDAEPDRIQVVPNGVNLEEFEGGLDEDRLDALKNRLGIHGGYFIHLGTIEPRKNLVRLLEAYARVREQEPDCPPLLLVGRVGWMSDDVFQTRARLGLEARVPHAGYVERAEALALLKGALACVYPTLYEGFGLPVLEAMAAGTPVIAADTSSIPEVMGDTGAYVEPHSVESIEAALLDTLRNPEKARARTGAAQERARQFSWDNSAATLEAVYRSVTALS